MTTTEIITAAHASGQALSIEGYITSAGAVINYTVKLLGPDGYKTLVAESLAVLEDPKRNPPRPLEIAPEVWRQALEEKMDSFRKTLSNSSGAHKAFTKELVEHPGGYATYTGDGETVVLRNLQEIQKTVVTPGGDKIVNSSAKTLAKAAIDRQLPIGKFIGQLNLAPGKFTSITKL